MRNFLLLLACLLASTVIFGQSIQPAGPVTICQGGNVTLGMTGVAAGANYQWQFSTDGGTTWSNTGGSTQTITVAAAGSYQVLVTQDTITTTYGPVQVLVSGLPNADFTFSPNAQCSSIPISFTNTSTGTGLTYEWNFGDPHSGANNTSTLQNPVHHFAGAASGGAQNFTVSLIATNSAGCKDTVTRQVSTSSPNTQLGGTGFITYNGLPYFTQCASTTSNFTFTNQTTGNTGFTIIWGDNSPNFTAASFASTTHTYSIGSYSLQFIVTGSNGCVDTATYYVFVGNNPAVGLNNPGNTFICSGTTLTFPITGTTNNPPGTIYTVSFNDRSAPDRFTHPAPPSVTHYFAIGSCGTNTNTTFPNSFQATIQASNPCGTSAASVVPIYVSQKDSAVFAIGPRDTVCTTTNVMITNTSSNNFGVSAQGNCLTGKGVWQITPATGWTLNSGTLGDDFGTTDPGAWTVGSTSLNVRFTTPGTYSVRLRVASNGLCGASEMVRTICVNPAPVANFSVNTNAGCSPLTVSTTNLSNTPTCGSNTYLWSVAYANSPGCTPNTPGFTFINGTTATSANPQFQFTNPGVYTITLVTRNSGGICTSAPFSQTITVKTRPQGTLAVPAAVCQNGTINPTVTVNNCLSTTAATYSWSFPGGVPASSTSAVPGAVTYATAGNYTVTVDITNECGTTTLTQNLIVRPSPDVTVPANQLYCAGVTGGPFTLTSALSGTTFSWTNSNPAIGLAGSGATATIPSFTAANTTAAAIIGTITATPVNAGCTGIPQSFTITVNPRPAAPAVTTPVTYCQGETAAALTATTTAGNNLLWYTTATGGTGSTTAPTPATTATGNTSYWVSQVNPTFNCESPRSALVVTVKPAPAIGNATANNPTSCNTATGSIVLTGLTAGTYTVNFSKNGIAQTPLTLTAAGGTITIGSLTSGTYSQISVTLAGCPSNVVGPFSLSDPNPPATPSATTNAPLCSGGTLTLSATSATPGVSYTWSGPNGFNSNLASPTLSNVQTVASGTYSVTASLSGCTSPAATVNVLINPTPAKPVVVRPVVYCQNATALALTATAASGNSLTWFDNPGLANGSTAALTPVTTAAGSFSFYVNQTNSLGCTSDTSVITVTVQPSIASNVITANQTLCSGNTPAALAGQGTPTGGNGSYSYQWQQSTDGGTTWTDIPGATGSTYSPGALFATTHYRRVVSSGACSGNISNAVIITIQGTLSNVDVTASQTICAGSTPQLLNGQPPSGGDGTFVFQWESSFNNTTWTPVAGATSQDYQPPVLNATTYYRRRVTSGPCSAISSTVTITVNPVPVMTAITPSTVCNGTAIPVQVLTSTPSANVTYAWTNDNTATGAAASGTGNIPAFTATNTSAPKVPVTSTFTLTPTYTFNNVGCTGAAGTYTLTVLPTLTLSPVNDTVVCTGTSLPSFTPSHDAGTFAGSSVDFQWTVSGSGITLAASGTGGAIPAYTTSNPGTTDLVATITVTPRYRLGTTTCNGTPVTYRITVKPATPGATGGPDTTLCASPTYTMRALQTAGTTGLWTQLGSTTAVITDPGSATTTITGLQPSTTYVFVWTVTGFANCPPTIDTVRIVVNPGVTNTINTTAQTICSGQSVTVTGNPPSGGDGNYSYQWQQSTDGGTTWADIPGQTGANLTFSPTQNLSVRRVVRSFPCIQASAEAQIVVQPPVGNNTITADHSICINTAANALTGSTPVGANGVFSYQWQQSVDGGTTWTAIAGATAQGYSPGVLTATTQFRRVVSSTLCSGPQSSTSNVVTVTVNLDARALFTWTRDTSCAPFVIDGSVITLQPFPARNGSYQWFANGNPIGTGTTFPGFTISGPGSSAIIQLVTTSPFGCLSDTLRKTFYTPIEPRPSFTLSDTVGCGPLTVQLGNTTPNIGQFTYLWNFGNGQTSTLVQPGAVVLAPNPAFGDTTYFIKLTALTPCVSVDTIQSVRVKSKPKALFAPSASVGCSPMTVTFNNISRGLGNSYLWNFGDGSVPVTTSGATPVSHTFTTAVRDTFFVRLVATNECGSDTLRYAIVVAPNSIRLDFAINGNQQSGCSPHPVSFINNSQGATTFNWNFGDGNTLNTTRNIDTIRHLFQQPGTYVVTLRATNGCSDTTSTETITVYPRPRALFTASRFTACLGDSVRLTNASDSATSYFWNFGDGNTSTLTNPVHLYRTPGVYTIRLIAFRFNAPGTVCSDTTDRQVQVVASQTGSFAVSDSVGNCAPFTVTFTNGNLPSTTTAWDFGDGNTGTGDVVTHTFQQAGSYQVQLTSLSPGGCTYVTTRNITVLGPRGTWTHTTGYLCNSRPATFQVTASHFDSLIVRFGDGNEVRTTNNVVFYSYPNPGVYLPSVIIKDNRGCSIVVPGRDSLRVDRIRAGFTATQQRSCGSTSVRFTDTSFAYFGKTGVRWNFGDNTTGTGSTVTHSYAASGIYQVQLIVQGVSGCQDTVQIPVDVQVNSVPRAAIQADSVSCVNYTVNFAGQIQSIDAVNLVRWNISNGVTSTSNPFSYRFTQPGLYTVQLITGTVNGCFDTAVHQVRVNPSPTVTASNDLVLCRGSSAPLNAAGINVATWSWSPLQGLSCYTCPNPIASPTATTPYLVQGTNSFGCSAWDTVVVTVIQPLRMTVSSADSICIGQSTNLLASGAAQYSWSPAAGLNNTTIANPNASPAATTRYQVVGYDGFNCFTDTAYVLVAVGQYPTITLGPDLTLAAGTQQPLNSLVQNGPIRNWAWTPSTDLSCAACPLPVANIRKDISYVVTATSAYGCSATDTLNIKVFCESTQVFIPNAFTPDGDGINDVLMVRAKGVAVVKTFRIFNRWGEVVFERANFPANNPAYGWNGKINGVAGGPDVFVYTAEVLCENGAAFTYKGNVSIIK